MNLDEYFIELAKTVALRSEEPSTKVGCVIVNENNEVISVGANNYAIDSHSKYSTDEKPVRYLISVHAEMHALAASNRAIRGCKVYVTHASCENCLKNLIVAGVKEIIYDKLFTNSKFMGEEQLEAAIRLTKGSGIINRNMNGVSFLDDLKNNGVEIKI